MKRIASWLTVVLCLCLAACETPTSQRYAVSADNNIALRSLGVVGIAVGTFTGPANFNATCRLVGPLQVADGLTHTQYIQRAFDSELKLSGVAPVSGSPRIVLTGIVTRLDFSSVTGAGSRDNWAIDLTLRSSNGKSLNVQARHEFNSGFLGTEACRQTADAFPRAVLDLIANALRHSQFSALVR